jgi:hypothetical protein
MVPEERNDLIRVEFHLVRVGDRNIEYTITVSQEEEDEEITLSFGITRI